MKRIIGWLAMIVVACAISFPFGTALAKTTYSSKKSSSVKAPSYKASSPKPAKIRSSQSSGNKNNLQLNKMSSATKFKSYQEKEKMKAKPKPYKAASPVKPVVINKKTIIYKNTSPSVVRLRNQLNYERYKNRQHRYDNWYGRYHNNRYYNIYRYRPVVYYHDRYSNDWFWYCLGSSWSHYWFYHHWNDIDPARRIVILRDDPTLTARIAALERANVPRNQDWTPTDINGNEDLQYNQKYVQSAFESQPQTQPAPVQAVSTSPKSEHISLIFWIFGSLGFVFIVLVLVSLSMKNRV